MSKAKKYSLKPSGFQKFIGKCRIVLIVLFAILLALFLWDGNRVRNNITAQLQPMIQEFEQTYGANSVDVKIKAEPGGSSMPFDLEYHIFLTVYYDDVRSMDESYALKILRNGDKKGSMEYSYEGAAEDYAIYTRTVVDTINGRTHAVFVTLSDGDNNLCLYNTNTYRYDSQLRQSDAYRVLRAPNAHFGQNLSVWIVILCVFGMISTAVSEKKRKQFVLEESKRFFRACRDGGMKPDSANGEKRALEIGKECGTAEVIKKFENNWKPLYEMGSEAVASQTFVSMADIPAGEGMASILRRVDALVAEEQDLLQRERKKTKRAVSFVVLAAVALVAVLVAALLLQPLGRYQEAEALLASGDADGAYAIYQELGAFMDSREKCKSIDYDRAVELLKLGKFPLAYQAFGALGDYSDAAEQKAALERDLPCLAVLNAKEGDIITFGKYEQDNNLDNGAENIEWIVLNNGGGRAFLVSRHILDTRTYSADESDGLDLETWLSTSFADTAFYPGEKEAVSKITLLERQDVENYKLKDGEFTPYAMAQGPRLGYDGNYWWWLYGTTTSFGGRDGYVLQEGATYVTNNIADLDRKNGVRPAIWLFGNPDQMEEVSGGAAAEAEPTQPVPATEAPAEEAPAEEVAAAG